MIEKVNKILSVLYFLLFFLTPLIFFINTSELFEFAKILTIYSFTILIGFFWLIKMILTKKLILQKTKLDIPIFLFLLSQILSTIFSLERHTSFWGYYGRFNGGLISTFCYIILYYGFLSNNLKIDLFLKASFFSSIFVIFYAIPGKLGHDITCYIASNGQITDNSCWSKTVNIFDPQIRAFSTLGQPNWLGAFLSYNFFIALYFLNKNKNLAQKIFLYLYLFLNFSFILFTRSKSAILATLFSFSIFFLYFLFKKGKRLLPLIVLPVIILPIIFFKTQINQIDRFFSWEKFFSKTKTVEKPKKETFVSQNLNITDSFDIRKIVWQGAIDLGKKYPLFGSGLETFAYSYYLTRPISHNYTSEWDFVYNKAHNEFLNYLSTSGFFGLGSYLLVIVIFFYFLIKKIFNDNLYFFTGLAFLTILITNFFGFSTTTISLAFYIFLSLISYLKEEKEIKKENLSINLYQKIKVFILIILVFYLFYSLFSYYQADVNYYLGLNYLQNDEPDYQKAAFFLKKALEKREEPVFMDKFSQSLSYLAYFAYYQKNFSLGNQLIDLAKKYNDKTFSYSSKNVFYLKTKGKINYLFFEATKNQNYLKEGINALIAAEKLAPTDPKIPYTIAIFSSSLENNKENVKKYLEKALFLKNDFKEAKEVLEKIKSTR